MSSTRHLKHAVEAAEGFCGSRIPPGDGRRRIRNGWAQSGRVRRSPRSGTTFIEELVDFAVVRVDTEAVPLTGAYA
jgi:hypothetical protein